MWPAAQPPGSAAQLFRPVSPSAGPAAALKRQQVNQTLIAGIINAGLEKCSREKRPLFAKLQSECGALWEQYQSAGLLPRHTHTSCSAQMLPGRWHGRHHAGAPTKHREMLSQVTHTLRPFPSSETYDYSQTQQGALRGQTVAHQFFTQAHFYPFLGTLVTTAQLTARAGPSSKQSRCPRTAGQPGTHNLHP